jgi:hypothetical protein
VVKETSENFMHIGRDNVPEGGEEAWAKTIWARTGIFVHGMQGSLDFAHGERINKRSREGDLVENIGGFF